jgi:hypothetical protein
LEIRLPIAPGDEHNNGDVEPADVVLEGEISIDSH